MIKKKIQNFIIFNGSSDFNIFKIESVFSLNKLSFIFNNWNLNFFKLKRLGNSLKILNLYTNAFIGYFFKLEQLLLFLKLNSLIFMSNLKLLNISYNGFFLNFNYFYNLNFFLFSNLFIILFFNLLLSIVFNLLYLFIYKLLYVLNFSFFEKREKKVHSKKLLRNVNSNRCYCTRNKKSSSLVVEKFLYFYILFLFIIISLLFLLLYFCETKEVVLLTEKPQVSDEAVIFLYNGIHSNDVGFEEINQEKLDCYRGGVDYKALVNDEGFVRKVRIYLGAFFFVSFFVLFLYWLFNRGGNIPVDSSGLNIVEDAVIVLDSDNTFEQNKEVLWNNCAKNGVLKGHLAEVKEFSYYLSMRDVDFKKITPDEIDKHFVDYLKESKK